ncbi:MAG TPA: hypothetical protein VMR17_15625 [Xanthobacteraceae bacterium]|nr:hypothetical protein [Xanthobacteraceae bacterium]
MRASLGYGAAKATPDGRRQDQPLADIKPFQNVEIAKWADVVKRAGNQV